MTNSPEKTFSLSGKRISKNFLKNIELKVTQSTRAFGAAAILALAGAGCPYITYEPPGRQISDQKNANSGFDAADGGDKKSDEKEDGGPPDTGFPDAGFPDTGFPDAGDSGDNGAIDAGDGGDDAGDVGGDDAGDAGDAGDADDAGVSPCADFEQELCTAGVGECLGRGVTVCDPMSPDGNIHCDASPGAPEPELCDGLDNDCDGGIDNEPHTLRPIIRECASAICAATGIETCINGTYMACTAVEPDRDEDTVPDCQDSCPDAGNADQQDANGNGIGDACDATMGYLGCVNVTTTPPGVFGSCDGGSVLSVRVREGCGNVMIDPQDGAHPVVFAHNITGVGGNQEATDPSVHAGITFGRPVTVCVGRTDLPTAEDVRREGYCSRDTYFRGCY